MNKNCYVFIMTRDIGIKFWPMSRWNQPNQFIDILSNGILLIQQTFERLNWKEFIKKIKLSIVAVKSNDTLIILGIQPSCIVNDKTVNERLKKEKNTFNIN